MGQGWEHDKATKMSASSTVLVPRIESRIQVIRGVRVMIDVDLATLYGVQTKRLNEQVKRNRDRFPSDFLFQLTLDEKSEVVANCDHLQKLKFSKVLPFAFTEHGAIQAANVLASGQAVEMGIYVVRLCSCVGRGHDYVAHGAADATVAAVKRVQGTATDGESLSRKMRYFSTCGLGS